MSEQISGRCTSFVDPNWRILIVIITGVWLFCLEIITKTLGFNFFIVVTMLLLTFIGLMDANKCWGVKETLISIVPPIVLVALFSLVVIFTNSTTMTLLGLDETTAVEAEHLLDQGFANVFTLALTTTPSAVTLSWFAVYLPFYVGGFLAFVAGDAFNQATVKGLAVIAIFMPVVFQLVSAFGGVTGLPGGVLEEFLPDIPLGGNALIAGFLRIAGSTLDWLLIGILLGAEKLIKEQGLGGGGEE